MQEFRDFDPVSSVRRSAPRCYATALPAGDLQYPSPAPRLTAYAVVLVLTTAMLAASIWLSGVA